MMTMARKPMPDADSERFGQRLRELRKGRGWTQAQLATQLGVDRAVVGNYELGLHYPAIPVLVKIARILEVSTDRLLGLGDAMVHELQDRRLHQLFLEVDRLDAGTQGLVKQVVERIVTAAPAAQPRTGTKG
jgi:transcriptional regulator with XRE-family HTH domain